ncbi:hypothetical protein P1P75_17765 [Streptomyces sp. ID05-39B]|uniref:hypothetical protein n=1 Tax=Streptomyces sp. ID05-39B TaxID=3028664 RepID=UPI0029A06100|nr:hypothetical protein [Streptomyces sp. ID05-39B]MDX3528235.1 hypothetical protein [Streptomyces sp. ID05-39B]
MTASAQRITVKVDMFSALTMCFTADLSAIVGEEPPRGITANGFIDLVERAMHVFGAAKRDHLQRASEELDYAVGHLTDALTLTGDEKRDRLERARTHLRYAIETTR